MRKPKRKHPPQRHKPHKAQRRGQSPAKWSAQVTRDSDALDLEPKVFTKSEPEQIARSLKRSAEASTRRKAGPFQSAMSMLNFYINRAGKNLSGTRLAVLERTKAALRKAFGRG
jgi:hypothetical protein